MNGIQGLKGLQGFLIGFFIIIMRTCGGSVRGYKACNIEIFSISEEISGKKESWEPKDISFY